MIERYRLVLMVLILVLFALPLLCMADPAVTIRKTAVRDHPDYQATEIAILAVGHPVDIADRQGGWYLVDLPEGMSGWLPLLSIRKESAGSAPVKEKTSGLRSLFKSYRTGNSGVTVATGVRGLDAVDLENSSPDYEELKRLDQYLATADEARNYARQAGLESRDIAWIQTDEKGR